MDHRIGVVRVVLFVQAPISQDLQEVGLWRGASKHPEDRLLLSTVSRSCCQRGRQLAEQALGRQGADEAEKCQPARAHCWWIWADRVHAL